MSLTAIFLFSAELLHSDLKVGKIFSLAVVRSCRRGLYIIEAPRHFPASGLNVNMLFSLKSRIIKEFN